MNVNSWFEVEDPEEGEDPWNFNEAELAFLEALRARADGWQVPPTPDLVTLTEDESALLVSICLIDEARHVILREWAVHFHGTHVRAGKVRDQVYNLHESPESGFFMATGTVEELAVRCADWFEHVLSRPVDRCEWPREGGGGGYVTCWEFADTGEALAGDGTTDGSPPAYRLQVRP
ncbi:hypothetical protein ABZZ17_34115 [Streptomyces sp. NPDC006512]|uniref:hypothetical protein n=1 Tax=Streptomyces sp. NPDC006512 TaxID=3154307 RepID=UPI0033B1E6AE